MKPLERVLMLQAITRPDWFTRAEYRALMIEAVGYCFDANLETRAEAVVLIGDLTRNLITDEPGRLFRPPTRPTDAS